VAITNQTVDAYLRCAAKVGFVAAGRTGVPHAYAHMLRQDLSEYSLKADRCLVEKHDPRRTLKCQTVTHSDFESGADLILANTVVADDFECSIDGLVRSRGGSATGTSCYVPILFSLDQSVSKHQRMLLAFAALVVGRLQTDRPKIGMIIAGPHCRTVKVDVESLARKMQMVVDKIRSIMAQAAPVRTVFNTHCALCEFREECHKSAHDRDELGCLPGIREGEIKALEAKGIFTTKQLSYTYRLRRRPAKLRNRPSPYSHALRALAIRENRVHIVDRPMIPTANVQIYVDLEGGSECRDVYLVGVLVERERQLQSHSIWSDSNNGESELAEQLAELLKKEGYPLAFHYGGYESRVFRRWAAEFPKLLPKDWVSTRLVNILSLMRARVYFPTFSNSLKEIGGYLGSRWETQEASGLTSLCWRRNWMSTKSTVEKSKLLSYNCDDCAALRTVTRYLQTLDQPEMKPNAESCNPVDVKSLTTLDDTKKWGERQFALGSFEKVADAAYFDYQRARLSLHSPKRAGSVTRVRSFLPHSYPKPNRIVWTKARKCWHCGSSDVFRHPSKYHEKLNFDLRVSPGCVKRWITLYRTPYLRCQTCGLPFLPHSYKSKQQYGSTLIAWVTYMNVVGYLSLRQLERLLTEMLGMHIRGGKIHSLKRMAADRYRRTFKGLLHNLVNGDLIHADETAVSLKETDGYVWVFASTKSVVYLYRSTREGAFLSETLKDFKGVLVSDFYAAYDSVPCVQQKCLVHLMWDINRDLLKHPFDDDLKEIATGFGDLLRDIIATVDRFGLRSRNLKRHMTGVNAFYRSLADNRQRNELSEHYVKRFGKYRDKLFAFLLFDGVPWNNNNAEHAIKKFAKYRRVLIDRTMTEGGLDDYLVLLSICVTCEYRGISFFDFLLSGKSDIDSFVPHGVRRRSTLRYGFNSGASVRRLPGHVLFGRGELEATVVQSQAGHEGDG